MNRVFWKGKKSRAYQSDKANEFSFLRFFFLDKIYFLNFHLYVFYGCVYISSQFFVVIKYL